MQRLISVILPIYNERISWIECAVNSVLQQTHSSLELIIVLDNPSREDVFIFIQSCQERLPGIIFIKNHTNIGLALSLNKAAGYARGQYIARMDADDIALPNRLERQIQYMENNPEVGLSGCQVVKIDEQGKLIARSDNPMNSGQLKKMSRFINVITHPTMIIRRSIFTRLSGYRDLPGGEDYDLVLRAIDAGIQIANLPDVLLHYRIRTDGETNARSGIQKLCFKYVQSLHHERLKTGADHFNAAHIRAVIAMMMQRYGSRQDKAQTLLLEARKASSEKKIRACIMLFRSFWISPIQRTYYWDWIRAEIIRKLHF